MLLQAGFEVSGMNFERFSKHFWATCPSRNDFYKYTTLLIFLLDYWRFQRHRDHKSRCFKSNILYFKVSTINNCPSIILSVILQRTDLLTVSKHTTMKLLSVAIIPLVLPWQALATISCNPQVHPQSAAAQKAIYDSTSICQQIVIAGTIAGAANAGSVGIAACTDIAIAECPFWATTSVSAIFPNGGYSNTLIDTVITQCVNIAALDCVGLGTPPISGLLASILKEYRPSATVQCPKSWNR